MSTGAVFEVCLKFMTIEAIRVSDFNDCWSIIREVLE